MRVRLPKSRAARIRKAQQWHDHFALWPVRTAEREGLWLETVDRRLISEGSGYQYKRKVKK